jgi:ATP-dependent DNA helicase RecG
LETLSIEGQTIDKKSLRILADERELAKDAVAFANAQGGVLLIGIEDDGDLPPIHQQVTDQQIEKLRRRIGELTDNLSYRIVRQTASNGSQYIEVIVNRNVNGPACVTDGKYLIRDGDQARPMRPNELINFMTDRISFNWELQNTNISSRDHDQEKWSQLVSALRKSERVSSFIKAKTDAELIEHYYLTRDYQLTQLGLLCIGKPIQRALLNTAPVIQCIKYDERGQKIRKWVWDDYTLSSHELLEAVWHTIPDWHESDEIPEGMFRKTIPIYDEVVVRELLANALVHRPYTQRGDIFINLYHDRLEIHNPGPLPMGVTPENILHTSVKRNENLSRLFYDLKLMEREGSGYDRIYEVLLSNGKVVPTIESDANHVKVTIYKKIIDPHIVAFMAKADESFQLTQKERICLGLLAQHKSFHVMQLTKALKLPSADQLPFWVNRLIDFNLVETKGKTRGKTFSIKPDIIKSLQFTGKTNLRAIPLYRLRELILEDLRYHDQASISEIHQRIGLELSIYQIRNSLKDLIKKCLIGKKGTRRHTSYFYLANTG